VERGLKDLMLWVEQGLRDQGLRDQGLMLWVEQDQKGPDLML
jgi:hypothetical protein